MSNIDKVPQSVLDAFEELALLVYSKGFDHYSAYSICHQIRWHYQIEKGDREFKISNNWIPDISRWFLEKHPDVGEFFETKRLFGKDRLRVEE